MKIRAKVIFIMSVLSLLPIAVIIGLSYTVPREQLQDVLIPLGIILSFLVLFFGVNIGRSITRPIMALAEQANRISRGDFSKPVKLDREDEIGQLSRAFNAMISQLRTVEQTKNDFIDITSHQLRTPQTIIEGNTEGLLMDPKNLTIQQIESLESIHLGTLRMIDVIETLLSISQFQLGQNVAKSVKVDLGKTIAEVLQEFRRPIKNAGLELVENYDKGLIISTDPHLLKVALRNLVSNGVMYTEDGKITVTARAEGDGVVVTVADTGIGVPAGEQPKIYEKFFRASNAKRLQPNGNGLGLHLVKLCLKEIDGSITFESEENEGSVFSIKLAGK
jgi:signal transduction histidine kinase